MKLRRRQYCKCPLPTCVDDVICVHHSSILFLKAKLLRKTRRHVFKLPKALSSSTKVMLASIVVPFCDSIIRFNTFRVILVCKMFH